MEEKNDKMMKVRGNKPITNDFLKAWDLVNFYQIF